MVQHGLFDQRKLLQKAFIEWADRALQLDLHITPRQLFLATLSVFVASAPPWVHGSSTCRRGQAGRARSVVIWAPP
jgi:hypothetical protein